MTELSKKIEYLGKISVPGDDGKMVERDRIKITTTHEKTEFTTIEEMERRKARLEQELAELTADIEAAKNRKK